MPEELPPNLPALLEEQVGHDPLPLVRSFVENWAIKDERHRAAARVIAERFFEQYGEALRPYLGELRQGYLVDLVTRYRSEGKEDYRVMVDMFLMARFPPGRVEGVLRVGP